MFIDQRDLTVRSGNGGDGLVAFRREKREPRGGPAGGDGGRGGDVILVADAQMTTFADMEDLRHVRAKHGAPGGPNKRHGPKGPHREFRVPVGTTVYNRKTGRRIIDLNEDGQRWAVARGGRGGRGNARFASAIDQAPLRSEPGRPGRERHLRLELRVLADVGLIGLPNAGKSTLLSRLSEATPRIADYPFTTLAPHLGVVELPGYRRFVMADLPGLIEGAHEGHGLGDRFLRHLERTRVLLHLVDPYPIDGSDPIEAWKTIRREVDSYGRGLADRPEIITATKADLTGDPEEARAILSGLAAVAEERVYPISAVTGEGLPALLRAVARALERAPEAPDVPDRLPERRPADGGGDDPTAPQDPRTDAR